MGDAGDNSDEGIGWTSRRCLSSSSAAVGRVDLDNSFECQLTMDQSDQQSTKAFQKTDCDEGQLWVSVD